MMLSAWPYILRVALATYFLSAHLPALLQGFKNVAIEKGTIFACLDSFVPSVVAYNAWHGFFVLLAIAIIFWRRTLVFMTISLIILMIQLYLDFLAEDYSPHSVLVIISILINIALLIIHGRLRNY